MASSKFSSIVRNQPSPFGNYDKITSKHLAEFVGKRVNVIVKEKDVEEKEGKP